MKSAISLVVTFAAISSGSLAAESPSFKFESKIGLPTLSLLEGSKEDPTPILGDAAKFFRRETSPSKEGRKLVSQMPVVTPSAGTDYKLRNIAPDESVDHKLVIKAPDVEIGR